MGSKTAFEQITAVDKHAGMAGAVFFLLLALVLTLLTMC